MNHTLRESDAVYVNRRLKCRSVVDGDGFWYSDSFGVVYGFGYSDGLG